MLARSLQTLIGVPSLRIFDGCVVCNDSIVPCACIVLLDGNCLLVNYDGVENELVDHCSIRLTFSLSNAQLFFPRLLFSSAILLVILGQ